MLSALRRALSRRESGIGGPAERIGLGFDYEVACLLRLPDRSVKSTACTDMPAGSRAAGDDYRLIPLLLSLIAAAHVFFQSLLILRSKSSRFASRPEEETAQTVTESS